MINNKKILAVCLARKGSIGLPLKNVKSLYGKPTFLWTVEAALKTKYIDKVVVNSCCPHVFKEYNKFIHNNLKFCQNKLYYLERSEKLNGPKIKNEPVLIDSYQRMIELYEFKADIIICLQPTSPFRYDNLISKCIEEKENKKANSLLTVTPFSPFFWHQDDKKADCLNDYYKKRPMRQDIKEKDLLLFDNGNVYITDVNVLLKDNNRIGGLITTYQTDKFQSLQIDTLEDFMMADSISSIIKKVI